MSMTARLARVEEARLREAIAHFAASWHRRATDAATIAADAAALAAAGYTGTTPDDLAAWARATATPEERAAEERLWAVVEAATQRPDCLPPLRAALAALAPDLGLRADDAPVLIIGALQSGIR